MPDLKWREFFEIGVDFIDADHKRLLEIMLDIKATIEESDKNKCVQLLNTFLREAKDHFKREEEYLTEVKYPNIEEHKIYHRKLLEKADITRKVCEGIKEKHDLEECFEIMAHFLIDDILNGDIMFKSYLEHEGHAKLNRYK